MPSAVDSQIVKKTETGRTIYERRAVRKYKDRPVSRDLIEQMLEAGRMAPSAMNKQPWHFYVLTDENTIQAFSREIAAVASPAGHYPGLW